MNKRLLNTPRPRQGGFAYVAAVLLLVVVAGLATAIVRLNAAQQTTANDALMVARASQAARAGVEWMIYRLARSGDAGCAAVTLDLRAATGFSVGITCTQVVPEPNKKYVEGSDPGTLTGFTQELIYQVAAVACNSAAANCPDNTNSNSADYTERRRVATVCFLEHRVPDTAPAGTQAPAPTVNNPLRACLVPT